MSTPLTRAARRTSRRRPRDVAGSPPPEPPPPMASLRLASASSRSSLRRSSTSAATRSAHLVGRAPSAALASFAQRARLRVRDAGARPRPVSASMRRTPAATALSPTIVTRPMSPVRATWVPPHSSIENGAVGVVAADRAPMETTRTSSPYFSPNSASAPDCDRLVDRHQAGRRPASFCSTTRLAMSSTRGELLVADRLRVREVEAQAVGRRPASPSARRDRRAPGAAPRAADASPNDWRGSRCAALVIDVELDRRRRRCSAPSSTVDHRGRRGRRASSACR